MPRFKKSNVYFDKEKNLYHARVTVGYNTNGKPNRKSFYGKTEAEALKKLSEYKQQINSGLNVDAGKMTFGEWLAIWMRDYKRHDLKEHTYDEYEKFINKRIVPALGRHQLLKLRPEHLQKFFVDLRKDDGTNPSTSMLKHIKSIISGALNQAMKNGLITRNYIDAVSLPKKTTIKEKDEAYTADEQRALLGALSTHRLYALFVFALETGARIGEILSLKWSNVDFANKIVHITNTASRTKNRNQSGDVISSSIKESSTKTEAGNRTIPLTQKAVDALRTHQNKQVVEKSKAFNAWEDKDLVFCTELGKHTEYSNVRRLYTAVCKRAGIKHLGLHGLRKTFSTNAISAGMNPYYLSRIMGHNSISMTLDVYTDFMPDTARSEMDKMDEYSLQNDNDFNTNM